MDTDVYVLDKNYNRLGLVDVYISLIWTERYYGCGEFELRLPSGSNVESILVEGNHLETKFSDRYMVIETIENTTDAESGDVFIATGRTLECLLERRIIWNQVAVNSNFQNGMKTLLNDNAFSPSESGRALPGMSFKDSSDTRITSKWVNASYWGENLYQTVYEESVLNEIGFRILPSGSGGGIFEFYCGVDRSYDQNATYPVVFSPYYDNLSSSDYIYSKTEFKTHAMVRGVLETVQVMGTDDEGNQFVESEYDVQHKTSVSTHPELTGRERRELFVDASGTNKEEGVNDAAYISQIASVGTTELGNTAVTEVFDGVIENTKQFLLNKDFFLGDIVQIENEYGRRSKARVTEIVVTIDSTGQTIIPSFTKVG